MQQSPLSKEYLLFYLLFAATLAALCCLTHPFMKYPFDIFRHLLMFDDFYSHTDKVPHVTKHYWHYTWVQLFHLLHIDNTQIFFRARLVHAVQVFISFIAVFYFSKTLLRNLFHTISPLQTNYLAYWATLIWFTIFATFSEGYHLVWIEWYSVTYQITLPFTLLITGWTISLLYEAAPVRKKILLITGIVLVSFVILAIHSMEYIYYLMYLCVLALVHLDKIVALAKRHFWISVGILSGVVLLFWNIHTLIHVVSYREPPLLHYLSFDKLPLLWEKILRDGHFVATRLSRAHASFNELYILSLLLITITAVTVFLRLLMHKTRIVQPRLLTFVAITSFFVFIPVTDMTAGIGAILTHVNLVNRFYYSSLLFLAVPVTVFYFLRLADKDRILIVNMAVALLLSSTYLYSKYDIGHRQNYYRNIQSIKNAFDERKIGFQLSPEQIAVIGKHLARIKQENPQKQYYFYAREDIAFVLKYVYAQKVYLPKHWNGRAIDVNRYIQAYHRSKEDNKILFSVPEGFPDYAPYR